MIENGWRVIGGWGDWGDDLNGMHNDAAASPPQAERRLQQATATTWTILAV